MLASAACLQYQPLAYLSHGDSEEEHTKHRQPEKVHECRTVNVSCEQSPAYGDAVGAEG